jgi:hypothetical protein
VDPLKAIRVGVPEPESLAAAIERAGLVAQPEYMFLLREHLVQHEAAFRAVERPARDIGRDHVARQIRHRDAQRRAFDSYRDCRGFKLHAVGILFEADMNGAGAHVAWHRPRGVLGQRTARHRAHAQNVIGQGGDAGSIGRCELRRRRRE